jgi:hypothetical protein
MEAPGGELAALYRTTRSVAKQATSGWSEMSRTPDWRNTVGLRCITRMSREVKDTLVNLHSRHPNWGPRKLRACLQRETPQMVWPAASSIGPHPRRKRKRTPPHTEPKSPLPWTMVNAESVSTGISPISVCSQSRKNTFWP